MYITTQDYNSIRQINDLATRVSCAYEEARKWFKEGIWVFVNNREVKLLEESECIVKRISKEELKSILTNTRVKLH